MPTATNAQPKRPRGGARRPNRQRRQPAVRGRSDLVPMAPHTMVQPAGPVGLSNPSLGMRISQTANGVRVRNREIVFTWNATATAGVIPESGNSHLMSFDTGTLFPSTSWLGRLAQLYDKWVPHRLNFTFVPSLPFTTSGQIGLWYDSDPTIHVALTFASLSGNVYAVTSHVSQPVVLAVRPNQLNRLPQYLTDPDSGDSGASAGSLNFCNTAIGLADSAAAGSTSIGYIWADYDITLLNPSGV